MAGTAGVSHTGLGVDLQEALIRIDDPIFREVALRGRGGLWSGKMEIATTGFTAGGLRMRYNTQKPHNSWSGGVTDASTAVSDPVQSYRYDDMVYKREHFSDHFTTCVYDQALEDYVNGFANRQDGLNQIAAKLMTDNLADFQQFVNVAQVSDRRAILGTVISSTKGAAVEPSGGFGVKDGVTYTGYYPVTLELGADVIMPFFQLGQTFSICVKPTNYGGALGTEVGNPCGDVRNALISIAYGVPFVVKDMPSPHQETVAADGKYFTVVAAVYYDNADKADVSTMIDTITAGAIGTGDVVTPYAGALAAAATTKTQGPNFGIQGLLQWYMRANIDTATGACTTQLKTSEGVECDRTSGGTFDWWIPYIYDAAGVANTFAMLRNVFRNLGFRNGGTDVNLLAVMNQLNLEKLMDAVSESQFRIVETPNQEANERFAKYGMKALWFQGIGTVPTPIMGNDWIPPMIIPVIDPSDYTLMSPVAGRWLDLGTGHIWHELRDTSGKLKLGSQAVYARGLQMHAKTLFNQGGICRTKPA
jgi:hypothetical protein